MKSLFTSIPVEESTDKCERKLKEDKTLQERTGMEAAAIICLLCFFLTITSFQCQGSHYQQLDEVAMGSPASPMIGDKLMEDKTFVKYTAMRLLRRLIDNFITVVMKDSSVTLLRHLNTQHPRIKFSLDEEENRHLPFMDITFSSQQGRLLAREEDQNEHTLISMTCSTLTTLRT